MWLTEVTWGEVNGKWFLNGAFLLKLSKHRMPHPFTHTHDTELHHFFPASKCFLTNIYSPVNAPGATQRLVSSLARSHSPQWFEWGRWSSWDEWINPDRNQVTWTHNFCFQLWLLAVQAEHSCCMTSGKKGLAFSFKQKHHNIYKPDTQKV